MRDRSNPRNAIKIGLVADGMYHHGRQVLLGAREWCLDQSAVQSIVFDPKRLQDKSDPQWKTESFDALILYNLTDKQLEAAQKRVPHVVLTWSGNRSEGLPHVITDSHAVGRQAADYFLHRGYRSFACLHRPDKKFSIGRIAGFKERLEQTQYDPVVIEIGDDSPESYDAISALPRPLAVFSPSDGIARRLIDRLVELNLHIPREISVLGVDDDPYQNSLCRIPLSSVRLAGHAVGARAAELACQLVGGSAPPDQAIQIPPVGIAGRLSTEHFACEDTTVSKVLKYIHSGIGDLYGVDDLVDRMKIPRRTLEWRFRKSLGRSIHNELSHARLHKARELLATTNMTAEEITVQIGLSEGRMLNLLFKRMTGMTPSEYRSMSRGHVTSGSKR